ncbi:hypothetical protein OIDMADRAFT_32694 [Oidiodendron maius Zn]|uniref:Uncharacterized protein n=1 Tax=Oidiodendron maius (strain Zn) TaxID=913774 RepID=A0A0C3H055_OIDMZ|nr:hypothetical protein OIDMADRAFT_32694 [Oidiodendron maius Zn]
MPNFHHMPTSCEASRGSVQRVQPVPTQQRGTVGRNNNHTLEYPEFDPAILLSAQDATLLLQSPIGPSTHASQHPAPSVILQTPPAAYAQDIFQTTGHCDIGDLFCPQEGKIPKVVIGDYPQIRVPLSRHPSLLWRDQEQSWLEWGETSAVLLYPRSREASQMSCDQFGDKSSLNLAVGKPTTNLENDACIFNSDDTLQAQWGSDPAFSASYFVPPPDQLTEAEVSIIWKEYFMTSLKPRVSFVRTDVAANQQQVILTCNGGIGRHEVESLADTALTCSTPSTSLDSLRSTTLEDLMLPPAVPHRKSFRRMFKPTSILIRYVWPPVNIQFAFSGRKSFFLLLESSEYLYLLLSNELTNEWVI